MDTFSLNAVPREQWQKFFDGWSRAHKGEPITLTGLSDSDNADPQSAPLPLVGISLDPRGSEAGHLIIMLGDTLDNNHEHILPDITEVRTRSDAEVSNITYLQLERADGNPVTVQAGNL